MPPPIRKLNLEDNSILQTTGGIGTFRQSFRVDEMKREKDNLSTLASIRDLGATGAADLQQYGYMLVELPDWLNKLLRPSAIERYIGDAGGYRRLKVLNGKRLFARTEPLDNTSRFDEAAAGLAAASRLIATALLGHRHEDILTPAAVEMLQPVEGAYEFASEAHINVYRPGECSDGTSAYSPHVDGGLLTLVTCPVRDRCLVVQRPGGGGEVERVPLEPGVAAVLPGVCLGMDPQPCKVSRFAPRYTATQHHVDRAAATQERASVTFHLRPNPEVAFSSTQTAGDYMERFYSSVQRVNAAAGPVAAVASARHTGPSGPPVGHRAGAGGGAGGATAAASMAAHAAVRAPAYGRFDITIVHLDGKRTLCAGVTGETTVEEVMHMVADIAGVPVDMQRLIYAGSQMETGRTLGSYKIWNNATVHLSQRLRGD